MWCLGVGGGVGVSGVVGGQRAVHACAALSSRLCTPTSTPLPAALSSKVICLSSNRTEPHPTHPLHIGMTTMATDQPDETHLPLRVRTPSTSNPQPGRRSTNDSLGKGAGIISPIGVWMSAGLAAILLLSLGGCWKAAAAGRRCVGVGAPLQCA